MKRFLLFILWMGSSLNASFYFQTENVSFSDLSLELVMAEPTSSPTSHTLIVLLHGAAGNATTFQLHDFSYWLNKGCVVGAISLPGFGNSEGYRDMCGPKTIDVLQKGISYLKAKYKPISIGVIGHGYGAHALLLVASQRNDLSFLIAANSCYDLMRHTHSTDYVKKELEKAGCLNWSENELIIRSPLQVAHLIKAPLYLLHKDPHPFISKDEVEEFARAILYSGGSCQTTFLKGDGKEQKISHALLIETTKDWIEPYIK